MENLQFDVQGIGRVNLIQDCGASLLVEDESGTRLSLPASRCVRVDQTAAALADQFTGRDMGAEMAAAERGDERRVLCRDCVKLFRLSDAEDGTSQEAGVCNVSDRYRALDLPRVCAAYEESVRPAIFLRDAEGRN